MTPRIKIVVGAVLAIMLAAGLYFLNARWIAPATMHKVRAAGKHPSAPDFNLTDINGAKLALSDYQGKVVLLDFWATWCGPCRIEIPEFVQMEQKYRDQGFAILGVAMQDTPDSVGKFYQQFHLNYPVAMGNSQLAALYGGIFGLPTSFLIGRDGRIYSQHSGTTGADVFQDEIQQLLAGKPGEEVGGFSPAGQVEDIEVGTPGEANADVPGVDVSKLSAAQLAVFEKQLEQNPCSCGGCKFTLLQCRRQDATCPVSKKMAREMLQKLQDSKAVPGASSKT
jgi:thiol-disulfide isomerase/thioredoxin